MHRCIVRLTTSIQLWLAGEQCVTAAFEMMEIVHAQLYFWGMHQHHHNIYKADVAA